MKIVVLDGYTENPGDLSWDTLGELGELTVYEHTPPQEVPIRAADAELVLTNKTALTADGLAQLPKLRYIGVLATGYNVVDVRAAKERGIVVTNIPCYGTEAVAQYVFALLLEICHHVAHHNEAVQTGRWTTCRDFCFWDYPLIELKGKTMGLIGYGRIGQAVAAIARAFQMQVLAYDPTYRGAEAADLSTLLSHSDVISLHCPLLEQTHHIVNADTIAQMKDGVILINTARGPLIDEAALRGALLCGKVAYAAVDVVATEPIAADNPLLGLKNCLITPHIAWAPKESRQRLMNVAVENVKAFLGGMPINNIAQ